MTFFNRQAPCLDQRSTSDDQVVFSTFLQGVRQYSSVADADEYAHFIMSGNPGSEYCNELLWGACATYADLDCPHSLQELGFDSEQAFVDRFNAVLVRCYEKLRGHVLWCG